jgi:signal-transduction protein with cAMP-binding, CBS, and nucleotidyltransferase domain
MTFRKLMVKNLHYLNKLNDEIINELICCMEVKRFAKDSTILKSGDVSDFLTFLRHGEIEIFVTNKTEGQVGEQDGHNREELHFDTLNTGSCICAYTFISDDAQ